MFALRVRDEHTYTHRSKSPLRAADLKHALHDKYHNGIVVQEDDRARA